jgi:hypothetical protein
MNESTEPASMPLSRWLILGFSFWVTFLLVLEPDNVARALRSGHDLAFDRELLRILGAATLGAAFTPLVCTLAERFPVQGSQRWRHALVHVVAAAVLAAVLIVISCVLAAWGFEGHWLPTLGDIRAELLSNWTLLVFALGSLTAVIHLLRLSRAEQRGVALWPRRFAYKSRSGEHFVDIDRVDWIEAQGNYVAMHVGPRAHLLRATLANIQRQLDPARFVRIHRRAIVAVDRIAAIQPEGNGDATLRLADGQELRASRSHRKAIREHWRGGRSGRSVACGADRSTTDRPR